MAKRYVLILVLFLGVFAVSGCGDDKAAENGSPPATEGGGDGGAGKSCGGDGKS